MLFRPDASKSPARGTPAHTNTAAALMIYAIAIAIAAGIGWISITEVEAVATAPGVVRFAAKAVPVSHSEGGRAMRVQVKEGAVVKAGDTLIDLENDAVDQ